jgi:uncharacterized protein YwqG
MADKRIWIGVGLLILGVGLRVSMRRPAPAPSESPVRIVAAPEPAAAPPKPETTPPDWRSLLEANDLSRYAPALEKLARPAVEIDTHAAAAAALAVGASRIGGAPDLPASFRWPRYAGKPLAFVAQIDLGEVARVMPDGPLPRQGHLWFFYAADQTHWGFDPKDAGSSVVHYEADAPLVRRALPDDLPGEGRFAPATLTFRTFADLPDGDDPRNPTADADDAIGERYHDVRSHLTTAGVATAHKLLGYPDTIQGPMESECAAAGSGIYMGDGKGEQDPRFKRVNATRYDWRLLMQVDSDDAAKMMWGDSGRLYFWIRDQDLRERRFDKAWMILQCG